MSAIAKPKEKHLSEEEWLSQRTGRVTATRVAAILGLHPYETPMTVYEDIKGLRVREETEAMWFGRQIEPFIGAMYAKRFGEEEGLKFGKDIVKSGFFLHPDNDRHAATPDYLIKGDGVLECKWAGIHAARNFGESDSDEVPIHYLIQVHWQLYVTGRKYGVLFLLSPFGMKRFKIERDDDLILRMVFKVNQYLGEYIDSNCPPPLSGHDVDTEWLKEKFPQDSGETIAASYELEETIAELGKLIIEHRAREIQIEEKKNLIKGFMGEASVLLSNEGPFSWKRSRDTWETDYENAFRGLVSYCSMRPDAAMILEEAERLELEFTTGDVGSRRFLVPWKSEKS